MDQYHIAPRRLYGDLKHCIRHYEPKRVTFSYLWRLHDKVIFSESLEDKTMDVGKRKGGISLILDGKEKFFLEKDGLRDEQAISYLREKMPDGTGFDPYEMIDPYEMDPNDPKFPKIRESWFRCANRTHLIEVIFDGKIPLIEYPLNTEFGFKHWCVDRSFK